MLWQSVARLGGRQREPKGPKSAKKMKQASAYRRKKGGGGGGLRKEKGKKIEQI